MGGRLLKKRTSKNKKGPVRGGPGEAVWLGHPSSTRCLSRRAIHKRGGSIGPRAGKERHQVTAKGEAASRETWLFEVGIQPKEEKAKETVEKGATRDQTDLRLNYLLRGDRETHPGVMYHKKKKINQRGGGNRGGVWRPGFGSSRR